jgi:membrane-associated phospholipid phosphatase
MDRRVATAATAVSTFLVVYLLAASPQQACAQAAPPVDRPGSYLRGLPGVLAIDLLSFPGDATDASGLPYLLAGVGMTIGGPLGLDDGIRNDVRPPSAAMRNLLIQPFLLRTRQLALGTHTASLGILTAGWATGNQDIARWGAALWESVLLVDLTVIPLKLATGRKRPGKGDPSDFEPLGELDDAFPSWHSAWSMATARLVAGSDADPILKGLAWLAATGITAQRVFADHHWLSDSIAGGLLGIWIGSRVAKRHFNRSEPSGSAGAVTRGGPRLRLRPALVTPAGRGSVGLRATIRFGL